METNASYVSRRIGGVHERISAANASVHFNRRTVRQHNGGAIVSPRYLLDGQRSGTLQGPGLPLKGRSADPRKGRSTAYCPDGLSLPT